MVYYAQDALADPISNEFIFRLDLNRAVARNLLMCGFIRKINLKSNKFSCENYEVHLVKLLNYPIPLFNFPLEPLQMTFADPRAAKDT